MELAVRVQSVFELFVGLRDEDGVLLITEKAVKQHAANMRYIWSGCLSDIPGMVMYYDARKSKRSAPCYTTLRGTSQLEAYHRWLRASTQGSQLSRKHFKLLLAHFDFRWNTRCGIRNRGRTDFGSYSHWIIEDIQDICGEHIDKEQFGEFEPAVKELDLARIGVKVEEIGLHATTIDKASSEGSADDSEEAEGSLLDDLFGDVDGLDDEEDDGDEDGDRRISEVVSGDWDIEETSPVRAIAEMKMFVSLVADHTSERKKRKTDNEVEYVVNYNEFAANWNKYVDLQYEKDKSKLPSS